MKREREEEREGGKKGETEGYREGEITKKEKKLHSQIITLLIFTPPLSDRPSAASPNEAYSCN